MVELGLGRALHILKHKDLLCYRRCCWEVLLLWLNRLVACAGCCMLICSLILWYLIKGFLNTRQVVSTIYAKLFCLFFQRLKMFLTKPWHRPGVFQCPAGNGVFCTDLVTVLSIELLSFFFYTVLQGPLWRINWDTEYVLAISPASFGL